LGTNPQDSEIREGTMKSKKSTTMRRLAIVIAVAVVLSGLTSCGEDDGVDWAGVCVDPSSGIRVADSACDTHDDWWYYAPGYYPAVGHRAAGGTRTMPRGVTIRRHVPARGKTAAPAAPAARQQPPRVKQRSRSGWGKSSGGSRGSWGRSSGRR
jgi:hypothetical protein